MTTSKLSLIWANKPGCSRAVAEIWIGREYLWCTLFIDDNDGKPKIELLSCCDKTITYLVDYDEAELLFEAAKQDLLAMHSS